jgi:hypothetical protein
MNASSPIGSAAVRALYSAVVAALIAGLTAYQTTDDQKAALLTGALAGLGVLSTRGLGEGLYDQHRDAAGAVKKGDVGAPR